MGTVKNVDEASFKQEISAAGNKLIVVDFYADWCGPCRMIAPKMVELAQEHCDVVFLKVNVDDNGDLSKEYGVSGIPHFVFIKNSKKVSEFSGANEAKIKETIQMYK